MQNWSWETDTARFLAHVTCHGFDRLRFGLLVGARGSGEGSALRIDDTTFRVGHGQLPCRWHPRK